MEGADQLKFLQVHQLQARAGKFSVITARLSVTGELGYEFLAVFWAQVFWDIINSLLGPHTIVSLG